MKPVELRLVSVPGQKPEFLAALEVISPPPDVWQPDSSVTHIVLENYTREPWALDTATKWQTVQVQSVDGRNKLPGFVSYLRERKKTAYGRYGNSHIVVVPPNQMSSKVLTCRIARLDKMPPQCPLKPKEGVATKPPKPAANTNATSTKPGAPGKARKGMGLLGNLVGAQKRTNQHLISAAVKKKSNESTADSNADSTNDTNTTPLKTAGQLLMEFRQEMEQEMLDFDIAPEPSLKVKLDLAGKLRLLSDDEKQTGKVTMEVLKYIVYEAAEEVNEEWIAHKEPSEFMDEVVITIYKEGEAPPEVLEDINKAELPEEVLGQQRALQQQQQRMQEAKANKEIQRKQKLALAQQQQQGDDDHDFAVLNTNKRDRRTIEEIQMERQGSKRQRNGS
eukprot:scaffold2366_cov115-Cylindrotheca_fusiformis.AAC.13